MPFSVPDYHKSLEHLHVGCEAPTAYLIPYHNKAAAKPSSLSLVLGIFSLPPL